jgi:carbamoyl-phosphate synthase large subunit
MGVHTGDSALPWRRSDATDKEYQRMRDAARRIISRVGVETGGSNIQFAVNPADGRMVVIEMNPRVSRSSALASKATGFPIAKIAAKLALGYHLDEIPNDITRLTPASFEPTIDYVVVKIPRWNFEKFPQADRTLTTQMKSVGEAMAIGRTFKEAFMKGVRSLELGRSGLLFAPSSMDDEDDAALRKRLAIPSDRRMWDLFRAIGRGWPIDQLHEITKIDPWFLRQFAEIAELRKHAEAAGLDGLTTPELRAETRRVGDQNCRSRQRQRNRGARAPGCRRPETGLQARRHLRRRVRIVHAVLVQRLRIQRRSGAERPPQGRDSRQRSESDRPGHRVRLLLLSRRLRAEGRRPRDDHGQLS